MKEAETELRRAVELDGDHVGGAVGDLGRLLVKAGRAGEAVEFLRHLIERLAEHAARERGATRWIGELTGGYEVLGDLFAAEGKPAGDPAYHEVRDGLDHSVKLDPGDHWAWFLAGTYDLWLGDAESYRRRCLAMLDRFSDTTDPRIADRVSKVCLLAPRPHEGWARAQKLAERAVAATAWPVLKPWYDVAGALAAHRAGRNAEVFGLARPQPGAELEARLLGELLLAMASEREGRRAEARLWLDLARSTMVAHREPSLEAFHARLLLREAEALIPDRPEWAQPRRGRTGSARSGSGASWSTAMPAWPPPSTPRACREAADARLRMMDLAMPSDPFAASR